MRKVISSFKTVDRVEEIIDSLKKITLCNSNYEYENLQKYDFN